MMQPVAVLPQNGYLAQAQRNSDTLTTQLLYQIADRIPQEAQQYPVSQLEPFTCEKLASSWRNTARIRRYIRNKCALPSFTYLTFTLNLKQQTLAKLHHSVIIV